MLKKIFLLSFLFLALFAVTFQTVQAQANQKNTSVQLINPIGGTEANPTGEVDTRVIFGKAIKVTLGFLGTFTLFVFFYGGFLWLTSAGNSDKVKKGFETMLYAVIGLFIIFGAYGILNTVISGITGGGGGAPGGINESNADNAECHQLDRASCDSQADRCKFVIFQMPQGQPFEECITAPSLQGYCETKVAECHSLFKSEIGAGAQEANQECDQELNECISQ